MKQKKIVIIMAGILAAAAAMTGCAEQNKTATQVDYTQNSQGKSEQRMMRIIQMIHRIHTWTIIHLKIMAQQATVAIKLIRQQIRR